MSAAHFGGLVAARSNAMTSGDTSESARKIAEDNFGNLGDTSTLADPTVVDNLIDNRKNRRQAA